MPQEERIQRDVTGYQAGADRHQSSRIFLSSLPNLGSAADPLFPVRAVLELAEVCERCEGLVRYRGASRRPRTAPEDAIEQVSCRS
jgi:hypothetical protein